MRSSEELERYAHDQFQVVQRLDGGRLSAVLEDLVRRLGLALNDDGGGMMQIRLIGVGEMSRHFPFDAAQ